MLMMKLMYERGNQSLVFLIFIILEAKAWVTRKTEIHPMTEIRRNISVHGPLVFFCFVFEIIFISAFMTFRQKCCSSKAGPCPYPYPNPDKMWSKSIFRGLSSYGVNH